MSEHGVADLVQDAPASGATVRRHHTISSSSRLGRGDGARTVVPENTQLSHEDEVVDDDWVGPIGAVGEGSAGLHRQTSLPTRYHRGFGGSGRGPKHMQSLNSLSAIAGHEGEEGDWEEDMRRLHNHEELELAESEHTHSHDHTGSSNASPLTPNFATGHMPSPPQADSGVRRHQSLTAHGSGARRVSSHLKRSGTLQTPGHMKQRSARSPSPTNAEEGEAEEDNPYAEDSYFPGNQQQQQQQLQQQQQQQQLANGYVPSPLRSPWGAPSNEWRPATGMTADQMAMDDVQRALSSLELSSEQSHSSYGDSANNSAHGHGGFQTGQSVHPPRFNPAHPPPPTAPGLRGGQIPGNGNGGRKPPQVVTDVDNRSGGPVSASAYVNQPGMVPGQAQHRRGERSEEGAGRERAFSTTSTQSWDQKERVLGARTSNPNLRYAANAYGQNGQVPNVPPIPAQYLQQQAQGVAPRLGITTSFGQAAQGHVGGAMQQGQGAVTSPVDVPTLIATKGYNPVNFDTKPQSARFFVIKSYTEEDVHKSIKYEIWSSTDPGNKRLDKAFKETAGRGPIYLFFSVNASGHFCGMAEMLTPVDYTRSSTVWASDKWKGVFKVRWIFVRDIPNATLRHIKLNNTQERKPVTNSRDTQELLLDAGHEMLRIFHNHPARTSLLQDFSYYELQSAQKGQLAQPPVSATPQPTSRIQSPQPQSAQLSPQQQQHPYAMTNPAALAYATQQGPPGQHMQVPQMGMSPMMAPMGMGQQFAMQNIMRHPSPGPVPMNGQQYMGMGGNAF